MTLLVGNNVTSGYTTGALANGHSGARFIHDTWTATSSGNANSLYFFSRDNNGNNVRLCIYNSSGALLGYTSGMVNAEGWISGSLNTSVAITSGLNYKLGFYVDAGYGDFYTDGGGSVSRDDGGSYTTPASSITSTADGGISRFLMYADGTTGGVTVSLSGQAVAADSGVLTTSRAHSLAGSAPQGQAGTIAYSASGAVTLTLSGAQSTSEAGAISIALAKALSGQASNSQAGTITPTWQATVSWDDLVGEDGYRIKWGTSSNNYTASADVAADTTSYTITGLLFGTTYYTRTYGLLAGVEQEGSVERVLTQNDVTLVLSGASATTTAGTISYGLSRTASGQLATVFPGAIATARTLAPTGAAATAQTGTLAVNTSGGVTAALTGAEATSSAGTVSEGLSLALTGLQITATPGSVSASSSQGVTLTLSGQAATATAGSLSTARAAALSGTVATMLPGNVGMPGNANPEFDLLAAICRLAPRGTRLWRACRAAGYPVR